MSTSVVSRKIVLESLKRQVSCLSTTQSFVGKSNAPIIRQYHQLTGIYNTQKCTLTGINKDAMNMFKVRVFSDKSTDEETKKDEENAAANDSEGESEEDSSTEGSGKEEEPSEVEKLHVELKQIKDQLLRSLAEQENIRRIAKKDVDNAKAFAIASFAKSLLDTSDNLTRALDAVPEEYRNDKENHAVLATLFEGIKMTDDGLTKAFAKNGLTKFGAVGDKFDPNMHEALFEYQDENLEAGSIGQVMKVGFSLKERVIRPAEVGVIKSS